MKNSVGRVCLAFLLLTSFLTGCSPNVKQSGRVTFSDDGSPLNRGIVCFENDSMMARGTIQPDGSFQITSVKKGDGLPPGTYNVYFTGLDDTVGEGENSKTVWLLDPKYFDADQSGISVTINKGDSPLEIKVDRPQK